MEDLTDNRQKTKAKRNLHIKLKHLTFACILLSTIMSYTTLYCTKQF